MLLKIYPDNPDLHLLRRVVEALEAGEIIIYPTGLGYAYGCSALKPRAVEQIYRLKRANPNKQRFALMCASVGEAAEYAKIDNAAFRYIKETEKEPITYILPVTQNLPKLLKAPKEIGIRLAQHPIAALLVEHTSEPICTASLPHRYNEQEVFTHPELVEESFGRDVFAVMDGGAAPGGQSAIIRLQDGTVEILREASNIIPLD